MTLFADALLRRRALAVALGVGAFLLAAGGASAEPKVLAKIDGVPITEEDVNDALEALLTDVAAKAATDDAEHKAYDEAAKANPPVPEIHARHILLPTEDEAKAALARIKKGEDFAKVATELSKDPGSEGGDLGWFTKDKMVPEFADAAF